MQNLLFFFFLFPFIYIVAIQLVAFGTMWWDKRKASKREWRTAEATLLLFGFLGGAIGLLLGMFHFRHKTQKRNFQILAILGLVVSTIIYWLVLDFYL
ncbi:MAG: conserved membrane protein of unknown function [Candidatus Thorarchaeota archaeon]|nr:MAG: conserved membrane protein of unknown function [Candidatus Thorarchaeota archaeon]